VPSRFSTLFVSPKEQVHFAALRFHFKKVLKGRDLAFDHSAFRKTPKKLPAVLSHQEVTRVIEAAVRRDRW
jgi:integrase